MTWRERGLRLLAPGTCERAPAGSVLAHHGQIVAEGCGDLGGPGCGYAYSPREVPGTLPRPPYPGQYVATGSSSDPAGSCLPADPAGQWLHVYLKDRRRRLFVTTNTDEKAIAAPAIIGLSIPAAASGRAATL